ncbi:quinone oxidoreductase family protein [Mycobacterium kyogaense]|uniref:quinone oxidoreductase family protein n=1 Tax=Mycobacterium kyogaense TaxID=2212479 RepID=UPI000DAD5025|nr:zinc-binding alcohol dehydrogenase family protein [Mycobacterium kyogaense]
MRAAILNEVGGTPAVGEFEDPKAIDGGKIGRVLVAGLNPIDRTLSKGGPYGPPTIPSVVGQEGIAELEDGSRVYFRDVRKPFGSMAELVPLDPTKIYRVPDGVDDALAVAVGIAGTAAWATLHVRAKVAAGESVLVLGASGVVGQIAVQLAKLAGARVVAAARHTASLERLKDAGAADETVVLDGDYAAALKDASAGGYDVVIDPVFGGPLEAAFATTKFGARYVVCGMSAGPSATITYPNLIGRTVIGHIAVTVPPNVTARAYEELVTHVRKGQLSVETERMPLDKISEAWDEQGSAPHRKLVIEF